MTNILFRIGVRRQLTQSATNATVVGKACSVRGPARKQKPAVHFCSSGFDVLIS
jgi:hypothetical protein